MRERCRWICVSVRCRLREVPVGGGSFRGEAFKCGPLGGVRAILIIGFDGQVKLEALRLYGLPEDAPAIVCGCPLGRERWQRRRWGICPAWRPAAWH